MDATNSNTALASAMVEELARCGVRHAALSPGSRSTPLALALWREPAIEATVIVDERSAGFFAVGAAQATGVPAVVLTTSGTAAANLHPALCEADEAGVPVIALTADRPPELRDVGAGQTIDQVKLYGDAVRWFCDVGTHEADDSGLLHFRSVACRAFARAGGDPRPGPVHLNVAWRDPLAPEARSGDVTATSGLALRGRDGNRPLTVVPRPPGPPAEPLVESVAERIANDARGLIVAGRMPGADADMAAAIVALARAAGYPVIAEPTSQLRFGPHDRELVVWSYEAVARAKPEQLAPELVVRFGELPTCKALRLWLAELQGSQLVVDPTWGWNDPGRHAGAILRADPAALATAVCERIAGAERDPGWARAWLDAAAAAAGAIDAELASLDGPTEPGVHRALGAAYTDGDLVYTASSMPIRDQEAFLAPGESEVTFLANRGANGIDGLVSSGIGAAVATGRATWILVGDLGLFHDMNGLVAARATEAPVRIVALNNRGGGIFDFLPQAEELEPADFEALLGTPLDLDLERIAALHGLRYERLDALDRLAAAAGNDATLIEVPVPGRRENVALHRRITERAVSAVNEAVRQG